MKLAHAMSRSRPDGARMQAAWFGFLAVAMAILFSATAFAQAPAAAGGAAPALSAEELTTLVGPIALYPDDLIAIILPAATSPLQIVQADRYLEKRKSDPKLPIDDKWDDAVKSLLNYPDVVKKMSNDLDWTSELGEAVVTDQAAVIEAVQVFRRQAKAAGNLKSDAKQVVKTEKEVIIVEPADPQVIYVPQYNPTTVVVQSAPPVYYPTPYPAYYYPYPPGAAMAAGVIWGAAIGAAWSGNRYGYGGGEANINVNNTTNVSRGDTTVNRGGGQGSGTRGGGAQAGSTSSWKSNKQPGQVSSSVGKTAPSNRAGDARGGASASAGGGARASTQPAGGTDRGGAGASAGGGARASTQPAGGADRGSGAGAGGSARASTQPSGGSAGAGGGGRSGGGDSGLGGYNSGRQTQADSSRGASSRSSMSSSSGGGSRSASAGGGRSSSGGGARSSGGGRSGGGGRR